MAFGSRHGARRSHGQRSRATLAALALAVIALVAACAAPGADGAVPSAGASSTGASSAAASLAAASLAGATALQTASRPTLARVASTKSPSAPAVSEPPPSGAAGSRLVTFVNRMQQTIWVAASPDPGQPLAATGWVLPARQIPATLAEYDMDAWDNLDFYDVSMVDYAAVFKRAEPYAYSYVDDDATSVFTCSGYCDYRITFGITP